jgi:hypothetical protein
MTDDMNSDKAQEYLYDFFLAHGIDDLNLEQVKKQIWYLAEKADKSGREYIWLGTNICSICNILDRHRGALLAYSWITPGDGEWLFRIYKDELDKGARAVDDVEIEHVIDKIQKLFALAERGAGGEAAAAASAAQKLLSKYHIEIDEVGQKEEPMRESSYCTQTGNKWKYDLASVVAQSMVVCVS